MKRPTGMPEGVYEGCLCTGAEEVEEDAAVEAEEEEEEKVGDGSTSVGDETAIAGFVGVESTISSPFVAKTPTRLAQ